MNKIEVNPIVGYGLELSPMIGSNVDGKPNFMAHAWRFGGHDGIVGIIMDHHRYTHKGITQNMTFSVNIASPDLARQTDYCGSVSGSKVPNKAEICKFKIFYGRLGTAPMIEQCPVNMECTVSHILDLGPSALFVGHIEQTYVSEECLTNGKPDLNKIKPLFFTRIRRTGHKAYEHLYMAIGIHPDKPKIAEIAAEEVVEHSGDWRLEAPTYDIYGIYRKVYERKPQG